MRLLFVADGRSPIALNWISYFVERGDEVHLASTFSCEPRLDLASLHFAPVAFSSLKSGGLSKSGKAPHKPGLSGINLAVGLRTRIRQWLGPLTLPGAAKNLRNVIDDVRPDLVHAMRIPYEGMLAALAAPEVPLLISVWGNDFTLHAPATLLMKHYTCRALKGAQALHTDCQRDMRLARSWGFPAQKPGVVLPGAGGIQLDVFYPPENEHPQRNLRIINPRGIRAYIRNDTFFRAIPQVLAEQPHVRFICPVMADEPQALYWVNELGVSESVRLLPRQTRAEMAELFRSARLVVSPSEHDGTPNTLLEAMACGCLPIAGDIESIREWITPGQNGILFDPSDPMALAEAILTGLGDDELFKRALKSNRALIVERAAYHTVMKSAREFYAALI